MKRKVWRNRARALCERAWREWCFARVVGRRFRFRLLLLLVVLSGGGGMFVWLEPERRHSLPRAMYFSWSLIFGEPPEEFPTAPALQALFFLIPVIGLTIIIEGIVDFAMIVRDRRRSEQGWCRMMAASLSQHVVLVGLGKLGFRTFRLLRELGAQVAVIESDPANQFLEVVRRDGSPIFIGDARREALLEDANVARAKSIILSTDDDLANLETALDARRIAPEIRVVLRMFDQNMADKIRDGFNIHVAMSQSAISAPMFAAAAIDPSIIGGFQLDDQIIVMQRWTVHEDGPLSGRTIAEAVARHGFNVVKRHAREGAPMLFPAPETRLGPGDELLIQGPFDALIPLGKSAGRAPLFHGPDYS